MKRILFSALIPLIAVFTSCSGNTTFAEERSGDNGDGTFTNPVLWSDCPDPDLIRVGDDYYLVTTTMHLMPGAPIMHSKDLVNWEIIGAALTDYPGPDWSDERHWETIGQRLDIQGRTLLRLFHTERPAA